MAKANNPWRSFWKNNRRRFESPDKSTIAGGERDRFLHAREILAEVSAEWMPVWKRQNSAYWILARLGAIEVRASFHWDQSKRKPRSLVVSAELVGDFMPEEIHASAKTAGIIPIPASFLTIDRKTVAAGRFAHAVRRGPFSEGLLSLPPAQFVVVADRMCKGQPDLPGDLVRSTLFRAFADSVCQADGLVYAFDEPDLFSIPTSANLDDFSEYRRPEEWCSILSELPERKGDPISPRTFRRWVIEEKITVTSTSRRQVAVQLRCLPLTMRLSRESRDAIVAKFQKNPTSP